MTTMNDDRSEHPPYLASLEACRNKMMHEGYTGDFTFNDDTLALGEDGGQRLSPGEISSLSTISFTSRSNPANDAVLYLIETKQGVKGTIVAYDGSKRDSKLKTFMTRIADTLKSIFPR